MKRKRVLDGFFSRLKGPKIRNPKILWASSILPEPSSMSSLEYVHPIGFLFFGVTGANQGTSVPTHVTKDYEIRENSSSLGPNIRKIQRPLSNLFLQRLKLILRRIKWPIKFLASVKFWF